MIIYIYIFVLSISYDLLVIGWLILWSIIIQNVIHFVNLVILSQKLLHANKFIIIRISNPAWYRQCVIRLEHVRRGGIIQDYHSVQVSSKLWQIFHKVAPWKSATVAEKSVLDHVLRINEINNASRVNVVANSEKNKLVKSPHLEDEVFDTGPHTDTDEVEWISHEGKVASWNIEENWVNKCLVKVKN